jgi:hypothetical protein
MQKKAWTFMVYNNYDDPTLAHMHGDIAAQLQAVGSTDEVDLVVLCDDRPASWGGQEGFGSPLFHIPVGPPSKSPQRAPPLTNHSGWDPRERNLGKAATLVEFFRVVQRDFPADRYALVLAGHGRSWMQCYYPDSDDDDLGLRRTATVDPDEPGVKAGSGPGDGAPPWDPITFIPDAIGPDGTSEDEISALGLSRAMAEIQALLGRPLDLLAFDACYMQSVEIAFEVCQHAMTMVGPEWLGRTWSYRDLCSRLVGNPRWVPRELAVAMVESYREKWSQIAGQTWTMSALDLAHWKKTQGLLEAVVCAYADTPLGQAERELLLERAVVLDEADELRDLGSLLEQLALLTGGSRLAAEARALADHIANDLVIGHASSRLGETTGLAVTFPLPSGLDRRTLMIYDLLELNMRTGWGTLVKTIRS